MSTLSGIRFRCHHSGGEARCLPVLATLAAVLSGMALAGCSKAPAEKEPNARRVIATTVLVKSRSDDPVMAKGTLFLFDPPGNKVMEVATNVRGIHVASFAGGELTILYERERRLVFAAFDPSSLAKRREHEIDVPQVKNTGWQ